MNVLLCIKTKNEVNKVKRERSYSYDAKRWTKLKKNEDRSDQSLIEIIGLRLHNCFEIIVSSFRTLVSL